MHFDVVEVHEGSNIAFSEHERFCFVLFFYEKDNILGAVPGTRIADAELLSLMFYMVPAICRCDIIYNSRTALEPILSR